mmetsp:Transcript_5584/g.13289  ORF Transcript_5584/g.13289 Transcript_5584/m.13289 type:complete len:279 (-) Transcript_5584:1150-1986(-)
MFQKRVQDASHSKRGLNDGGSEFHLVDLFRSLFKAHHVTGDLETIDDCLSICLESRSYGFEILPVSSKIVKCSRYDSCVLFENHSKHFSVEFDLGNLDLLRGIVLHCGNHGCVGGLGVDVKIVASPIGVTNTLNPTVAGLDFKIPAVGGIMSHFGGQVLSESESFRVHADFLHVQLCSSHKISKRFIVYQSALYCFANCRRLGLSRTQLIVSAEQDKLLVRNGSEVGVGLIVGIHKVFDFSHAKFTNTKKSTARSNFISESKSDLSRRKRHLLSIEIQ